MRAAGDWPRAWALTAFLGGLGAPWIARADEGAPPEPPSPRWSLGLGVGAAGAPTARPAPLVLAWVERRLGTTLSVRASPWLSDRGSEPGMVGEARIGIAALDLAACARTRPLAPLAIGACGGVGGGVAWVRAGLRDAAPQFTTFAPWIAGSAIGLVEWTVVEPVLVEAGAGAVVPFGPRTFELKTPEAERSNFTTYELGQVAPVAFVGVGVALR